VELDLADRWVLVSQICRRWQHVIRVTSSMLICHMHFLSILLTKTIHVKQIFENYVQFPRAFPRI